MIFFYLLLLLFCKQLHRSMLCHLWLHNYNGSISPSREELNLQALPIAFLCAKKLPAPQLMHSFS